MPNVKVLRFPVREETTERVVFNAPMEPVQVRVYACAGHCGALVSSKDSCCLPCAAREGE